ncbi:MAG: hypothetical protein GXP43_03555 [bacterium]|nr:hypothetical protein [bacterium]
MLNLISTVYAASSDTVSDLGEALAPYPGGQLQLGQLLPKLYGLAIVLGALAVLIFFIWGGIEWLTAGGDSDKVKNAQNKMSNAVIGLVILLAAWALWWLTLHITGLTQKFTNQTPKTPPRQSIPRWKWDNDAPSPTPTDFIPKWKR